jgi:hypothetical protein
VGEWLAGLLKGDARASIGGPGEPLRA